MRSSTCTLGLIGLICATLLGAGCETTRKPVTQYPPMNVAGSWEGEIHTRFTPNNYRLELEQDGASVSGTAVITNGVARFSTQVAGAVEQNQLRLRDTRILDNNRPTERPDQWPDKLKTLTMQQGAADFFKGTWAATVYSIGQTGEVWVNRVQGTEPPPPPPPVTPTVTTTIRAWIDGSDFIKVRGNQLWLVHRNYMFPGRQYPEIGVSTFVNGHAWQPQWQGNVSNAVQLPSAILTDHPAQVVQVKGRGPIRVKEQPTAANDYTLSILIDDDPPLGADWYELTITW